MLKELKGTKYSISDKGEVFYTKTGRRLSSFIISGSPYVDIRVYREKHRMLIRNLVAMVFFPIKGDEESIVINLDKDKSNNTKENLQWISLDSDSYCIDDSVKLDTIFMVDINTNELKSIYKGIQHVHVKTNYHEKTIRNCIDNDKKFKHYRFYNLENLNIIAVADTYMVFRLNNKLSIIDYGKISLEEIIKHLK